ncbi:MAG TPA: hypothetical protein VFO40_01645 [Chthoniobacterales bacterium]|nr:hypothetical protein [Chthoniobacterales bacterium]
MSVVKTFWNLTPDRWYRNELIRALRSGPGAVSMYFSLVIGCQDPGFSEAEVTGPTDGRCADNHVIQHLDLQESGAFGKSAS